MIEIDIVDILNTENECRIKQFFKNIFNNHKKLFFNILKFLPFDCFIIAIIIYYFVKYNSLSLILFPIPALLIASMFFIREIFTICTHNKINQKSQFLLDYDFYYFISYMLCFLADTFYTITLDEPTTIDIINIMNFEVYFNNTITIHLYFLFQLLSKLILIIPIIVNKHRKPLIFEIIGINILNTLIFVGILILLLFRYRIIEHLIWGIIYGIGIITYGFSVLIKSKDIDNNNKFDIIFNIVFHYSPAIITCLLLLYIFLPINRKYLIIAYWLTMIFDGNIFI